MTESLLNTPVLWINLYLQSKMAELGGIGMPIFPTRPSTIEDLTEQWITIEDDRYPTAGVIGVWDRMFRMRRGKFPHIRIEQLLYYFYATEDGNIEKMIKVQELVSRLLDRGDESAEDLNQWARKRGAVNLGTEADPIELTNKFYFHDLKIYQLEEARDIVDFGTARTYGANKIIIEYTYHRMPELTNADFTL